jgi:uncharacterized ferredoxin-like protein
VAATIDAVIFVGLADSCPPDDGCGACGRRHLRRAPGRHQAAPTCTLRDLDLGIAVGSVAKTAAIVSIDCRCQTRIAATAQARDHPGRPRRPPARSVTQSSVAFDRAHPSRR